MHTSATEQALTRDRFGYAIPIVKIGVSVAAMFLVALYVDPAALWERLRQTSPLYLCVTVLLGVVQVLIVGLRWSLLARFVNHPKPVPSFYQFQSINYASQFIGQFLPLLAADALRVAYLRVAGVLVRKAFISAAFDRGIALLLLALICTVEVFFVPWFSQIPGLRTFFAVVAVLCIAAISVTLVVGGRARPGFLRFRLFRVGWELVVSFRRLCLDTGFFLRIALLGGCVHGISILIFWLVCVDQGLSISIYDAMAVLPVVLFGVAVPISIAGWGVREGLMVALFSQIGVSPEAAVAASLAFGTSILIAALPGAFTLFNLPRARRCQSSAFQTEEELDPTLSESPWQTRSAQKKRRSIADFDDQASKREEWRRKARFFHDEDERYLSFLIPPHKSVLEIGCATGDTLSALKPSRAVGIDISPAMVASAKRSHPNITFHVADAESTSDLRSLNETFDYILVVDTLGFAADCQKLLENLHHFCRRDTRIVLVYYSHLWEPLLGLAERLGFRQPQPRHNVMSAADIQLLVTLAGMEPIKSEVRLLSPVRLFGLGRLLNRFIAPLPIIRHLSLRHYTVCRSLTVREPVRSASIVIPARNERGNIEAAIRRIPHFCNDIEVLLVEGHSSDGTFEEMQRVQASHPELDIKVMRQPGKGKADAVFTAFEAARGDVLFILDADLTMPPEQLPKFWKVIADETAEFANASRLIYPMEDGAMRFLNLVANRTFSMLFSWLLNQRITDTLCGTKVMRRSDYMRLKSGRSYFGDFDPFGDFDLIFGASKLGLRAIDVPIRYEARTYGETQISRFSHGFLLIRMVVFAFFKIKAL